MAGHNPPIVDRMVVEVSHRFPADPDRVWALLTDVERMAGLGPEHVEARWNSSGPALGSQFSGRNVRDGREWTMSCTVDVFAPHTRFGWLVGDPQRPTAWWRYEFRPDDQGGTTVTQRFTHGPGVSFLRRATQKYPDREAEFVSARAEELASGMRSTLAAAADLLLASPGRR